MAICEELLLNNEAAEVMLMIKQITCKGDKQDKQDGLLTYLTNNLFN